MRRALQALVVSAGAAVLALSGTAAASANSTSPIAYTCTGGDIPSGTYSSLTVTGACDVADNAVINVARNVYVAPHAVLDAQSAPSTITIGGNVTAVTGSLLGLGCQPDLTFARHPCTIDPSGSSTITVKGNITAVGADTVLING